MSEASIPKSDQIVVAALYKFVSLPDFEEIKPRLETVCTENSVLGTLLLAREGINGTVSAPRAGIVALMNFCGPIPGLPIWRPSIQLRQNRRLRG